MAKSTGNLAGLMRQFRREIRNHANRPILLHGRDGYGAVLVHAFSRIGRGEKLHDIEIQELMAPCGENLLADAAAPQADSDGQEPRRVAICAGPVIIPGGAGGKAVAILPVRGVALYSLEFQPYCFSTLKLGQDITAMANDPEIGTIILDIDSPGGAVTGTAEAAEAIWKARQRKKVVAFVNPLCASAAYWLASQASEIVAIPSADVGSIGVYMAHTDCSKFNEMQGMKVTYIHFGEFKIEGNSDEPLSDEGRKYYQLEVDTIGKAFHKAVARGRGTTVEDVAENFGKGRCMSAPAAKKNGLIDDFMTINEALAHCGVPMTRPTRGRHGSAEQPAPETSTLVEGAEPIVIKTKEDGSLYAAADWPKKTVFDAELIASQTDGVMSVDGDMITIVLDNGEASYEKIEEDVYTGAWVCALRDHAYTPIPADEPPAAEFVGETMSEQDLLAGLTALADDLDPAATAEVPAQPQQIVTQLVVDTSETVAALSDYESALKAAKAAYDLLMQVSPKVTTVPVDEAVSGLTPQEQNLLADVSAQDAQQRNARQRQLALAKARARAGLH